MDAFLRERLNFSSRKATGTSINEICAPMEAMAVRMKKITMKTLPNGMEAKTDGIVRKSSDGPAFGSYPKAKTAGKMAIPASRETARSEKATRMAVPGIFWSSRK